MRELPLSNVERNFILRAAGELKRLDGRKLDEFRKCQIHFGHDWGSCFVSLGETKVMATVSCDIQEPKATRPNEGLLYINVELSNMAAPHLEGGSRTELGVHLNRMLEKCIKESKAVDLESLCIVSDEKVWNLRVDVAILNHEGNLMDCACLAALSALAHFRRPDVTTDGQELKVHPPSERDPIPITLHHYPVCVSFCMLGENKAIFCDPTAIEERVADACLVFGINSYREICALHLGGTAVLPPQHIMRCASKASDRAKSIVEILKISLAKDIEERQSGHPVGFVQCIEVDKITSLSQDRLKIQLGKFTLNKPYEINVEGRNDDDDRKMDVDTEEHDVEKIEDIVKIGENSAELLCPAETQKGTPKVFVQQDDDAYGDGGPSKWVVEMDSTPIIEEGSDSDEDIAIVPLPQKVVESIDLGCDSDEEISVMDSRSLEAADMVRVKKQAAPARTVVVQLNKSKRKKKKKKNNS